MWGKWKNYRNMLPVIHRLCLHNACQINQQKKSPGRVKVDMTSSQLSTATVHILLMAKANHRIVCPSLHVFNDMGAHSHGRVANTQCLVTTQQPVCVPGASHFLAVLLSYMQVRQRAGKKSDVWIWKHVLKMQSLGEQHKFPVFSTH